jgi:RNA polymerase sigma-70 factor (ECF subfamily)
VNVNATDNALMAAVGTGEVQKLAVLFERHHKGLFRYFVSMNRNRELSEDLVQDVFFRMLRYRASYDAQQSFTAWMYQIARNASVDQAQKRRGEVIGIEEFTERRPEPASDAPGPEESAVRGQDLRLLKQALERLPADKKEILVLSRFQGMKYDELATVLGCEVGTVKVRVYRAMRALEQAYLTISGERTA